MRKQCCRPSRPCHHSGVCPQPVCQGTSSPSLQAHGDALWLLHAPCAMLLVALFACTLCNFDGGFVCMLAPALYATEVIALFAGHVGMCWSEAVAATLCLFCNIMNITAFFTDAWLAGVCACWTCLSFSQPCQPCKHHQGLPGKRPSSALLLLAGQRAAQSAQDREQVVIS